MKNVCKAREKYISEIEIWLYYYDRKDVFCVKSLHGYELISMNIYIDFGGCIKPLERGKGLGGGKFTTLRVKSLYAHIHALCFVCYV